MEPLWVPEAVASSQMLPPELGGGKREADGGSLVGQALDSHVTLVALHELMTHRKADPRAFMAQRGVRFDLLERLVAARDCREKDDADA